MKTGRNDPCPCGSGKKWKKCCALAAPEPGAVAGAPIADEEVAPGEPASGPREGSNWVPLQRQSETLRQGRFSRKKPR